MMWRNTADAYGVIQMTLHWLIALLIAVLLPLGLWMTGLDYYDPWYRKAPDLHRATGILLALLLILRIGWRLAQAQPGSLAKSAWEQRAAVAAHRLLYLLPLLLVVSGYLISTADGRGIDVFGWFEVPATLQGLEGQEDIAGDVHFALAILLLGVVTLHVMAALRHHLLHKDDTLRRMWPGMGTQRDR